MDAEGRAKEEKDREGLVEDEGSSDVFAAELETFSETRSEV